MSLFDDLPEPTTLCSNDDLGCVGEDDSGQSNPNDTYLNTIDYIPLLSSVAARRGERSDMQDAHVIYNDLSFMFKRGLSDGITRLSYFAIFDGHGGDKASNFAAKWLHYQVAVRFPRGGIKQFEKDMKRIIFDAYKKTDEDFLKKACQQRPHWRDGSTSATVFLVNDTLCVANLGDSKVVLGRSLVKSDLINECSVDFKKLPEMDSKITAICLTRDHNPMDYEERQRIQSTGAVVKNGRVNNILEISRSFGDYQFKKQGVTCIPDVTKCHLTDNDKFLLIACDGFWKSYPPERAVAFAYELLLRELEQNKSENDLSTNIQKIDSDETCFTQRMLDSVCAQLVNDAVLSLSGDNVTCILVVFPKSFKTFNSTDLENNGNGQSKQLNDQDNRVDSNYEPRSKVFRID